MAKANYQVNVYWEAVPYSESYYRLTGAQQSQVNALFLDVVNSLIPLTQQQNWRGINVLNSDYDDILAVINQILVRQAPAPAGKVLVLPAPQGVVWKVTQAGHVIGFFVYLSDTSGANVAPWEMVVTLNGVVHNARMGLKYECILI